VNNMGLGNRVYELECSLKILYGFLIYKESSVAHLLNKSDDIIKKIDDYFKIKADFEQTLDINGKMLVYLDDLREYIFNLDSNILNILSKYNTERYDNGNHQEIVFNKGKLIVPDPELINHPKYKNLEDSYRVSFSKNKD